MIRPASMQFLLVDDHAENRQALRWMLRLAYPQATVLEAATQEDACRISENDGADCIFLDASVRGFESVCSVLTQFAESAFVPLITVASEQESDQRVFAEQLGSEFSIRKDDLSVTGLREIVSDALHENDWKRRLDEHAREVARLKSEIDQLTSEGGSFDATDELGPLSADYRRLAEMVDPEPKKTDPEPEPPSEPVLNIEKAAEINTTDRPKLATNAIAPTSDEERELARQLQKELAPPGSPFIEGFEIAGVTIPAEATGGDYYDYLPNSEGFLNITIGECSGRGIVPTLLVTSLRAYLRVLTASMSDTSEIVSEANRLITEDIADGEFIVTLMLVQIDQMTKRIRYTSAGHQGYLIDRDGEATILHSTGMPLGLRAETIIPEGNSLRLRAGEMLLLVTDGAQKVSNDAGKQFGIERLLSSVRENRQLPPRLIVSFLQKTWTEFANGHALNDDVTIVVVKAEPNGN